MTQSSYSREQRAKRTCWHVIKLLKKNGFEEVNQNGSKVKNELISLLKTADNTVYDCTDDKGTT